MRKYIFAVLIWSGSFTVVNVSGQGKVNYPFMDPKHSIDDRVQDLIGRMTLEEKVSQLFNQAESIDRLGVPAYNWWNECLHGVARAGKATVFPQAIGLAATFDESLLFRVGTAVSDEARAKHHFFLRNNIHSIYTGLTFWTPNINIFRDPRWGRGQETYGEDPYLTGRMAVNLIKGLQGNDPKYFKTIATAKHYAVHSGPEFTRHTDNVFITDYDLYNTYLPAFKATVKEANVQSVMCAYNRFRDKPCCGSDILMANILRNSFGFKGYVVSDCGAVTDFYKKENHHVVETPERAWGWSISAGTDLNCEESKAFVQNIDSAVHAGIVNEKDINVSLTRLFAARFKLGMFDAPETVPYAKIPMSVVGSEEHLKLSLEAAQKSLVLLKNDGILPLKKKTRVALIGPNADNFSILIGNYNGEPIKPTTPLKALRELLGNDLQYSIGCPLVPGVYTNHQPIDGDLLYHDSKGKLVQGLQAEYFSNTDFSGTPSISRVDKNVDFNWQTSPIHKSIEEEFSVRWTGVLVPKESGTYQLKSYSRGGDMVVKLNDALIEESDFKLEKGKSYKLVAEIKVKSFWWGNTVEPAAVLSWVNTSKDYLQEARQVASKADVVIFCGGISSNLEGEEMKLETDGFAHGDRTHIELPQVQENLLKELAKIGKPIVYVNFSGSAVALNWQNENVNAIVQAFYPGETTGNALKQLLYGEFNPSGKLPVTFYKSISDLPAFGDYRMEGRTYRYFRGKPLYPFGYGLSYTTFTYDKLQSPLSVKTDKEFVVSAEVSNTGKMDGEEVVQLYITNLDGEKSNPERSLIGFRRVSIKAGETKVIEFVVKPSNSAKFSTDFNTRIVKAGKFQISIGGGQPTSGTVGKNVIIEVQGGDYNLVD